MPITAEYDMMLSKMLTMKSESDCFLLENLLVQRCKTIGIVEMYNMPVCIKSVRRPSAVFTDLKRVVGVAVGGTVGGRAESDISATTSSSKSSSPSLTISSLLLESDWLLLLLLMSSEFDEETVSIPLSLSSGI